MSDLPDVAELLDLDFGDFEDDLPFYEALARRGDGSVLELGVGTGRVAISLAREGFDVHGFDLSPAMVARANEKAPDDLNARLHLSCGDMRDFDMGRTFALVFAAYGTFHHLLTADEQLSCLRAARRHLSEDGLFVCDLRSMLHVDWESGESAPLLHDWTKVLPRTRERVTKLRAVRPDRAEQIQRELHIYDIEAADGAVRRITQEVDLRFTSRYEMEALLREAGLVLEQSYGDYDLTPYNETSESLITVARRGKEPS